MSSSTTAITGMTGRSGTTTVGGSTGGGTIGTKRHPRYSHFGTLWDFFLLSYTGGEDYIRQHLFKYFKEGDEEFAQRKGRAYRENHCKRVVDLINSYLFKEDAVRKTENKFLLDIIDNFDGKHRNASYFMKTVGQWASVFGRVYIVVDKKALPEDEATGTQADNLKAKPYCYIVFPQNVLDIAFDENGKVKWAIVKEAYRNDDDPFNSDSHFKNRYRLWEVGKWTLYDESGTVAGSGDTGLDIVPIVSIDNEEQDLYGGQSLISDIAYLDRAIFNNWSRLDNIVCDQTFSQLIFPIEGLSADIVADKELREQFLTLATNRIILYSAAAQAAPQFISPDASQAEFILGMIEKQVKQLYASLSLQAETAVEMKGPASGVSKAYDFDKLNKLLANKAANLEQAEKEIFYIAKKWMGLTTGADITVEYPDEFDVKSLVDEIDLAERLTLLDISMTFTKEIQKNIVTKALPKATKETIKLIGDEIDKKAEEEEEAAKQNIFPFDGNTGQQWMAAGGVKQSQQQGQQTQPGQKEQSGQKQGVKNVKAA